VRRENKMRTPEIILDEIATLEGLYAKERREPTREESQQYDALVLELREVRGNALRLAAMEDALAGRKNSCEPTFIDKHAAWQTRNDGLLHCSYCGSLHPDEAVKLLTTDGTRYSGSDWKYGFPHKFYIGGGKFYVRHLQDAGPEAFVEFARLSQELFGIGWSKEGDKVFWTAPVTASHFGYQRWGTVGKTTCVCGCVGGEPVGFCFCLADPKCHADPVLNLTL
jgi:hypothetical protein